MQETLKNKFEALKQAVLDVNSSVDGIVVPATQDVISIIAPNIESAEKMAALYDQAN